MFGDTDPAIRHSKERENDQRSGHCPRCLLRVFSFLCASFAKEGQGDLTHGVEGGQECGDG